MIRRAELRSATPRSSRQRQSLTQIVMAEAIALVLDVIHAPAFMRERDVVCFVDKEAVCASAIRGSSSAEDVSDVVETAALLNLKLGNRVWYEWIDSRSNISDGLSREGKECILANRICATIVEIESQSWHGRQHAMALIH